MIGECRAGGTLITSTTTASTMHPPRTPYPPRDAVLAAENNQTFTAPTRDAAYTLGIPTDSNLAIKDNGSSGPFSAGVLIGVVHTAANGANANEVAYSAAGLTLYDPTGWWVPSTIVSSSQ